MIPTVEGSRSSDAMIQFRVLGHVPPHIAWLKIPPNVSSCSKACHWTPSISCSKTADTEQLQMYRRIRLRHLLHSVVEPVAKHHVDVLNVDNGAALRI